MTEKLIKSIINKILKEEKELLKILREKEEIKLKNREEDKKLKEKQKQLKRYCNSISNLTGYFDLPMFLDDFDEILDEEKLSKSNKLYDEFIKNLDGIWFS